MTSAKTSRRQHEIAQRELAVRRERERRARRRNVLVVTVVVAVIAATVTAMMLSSRPMSSAATRTAPDFALTDTAGRSVHLADYRGRSNVVLYFSEGAGCGSCLQQMGEIEKNKAAFDKAGVTVLPIVMNARADILRDMAIYGVRTPFLLDDGRVSTLYKTIGHGMHAGLPGHSFVLVDKTGVERWYGEYPSMWIAPGDLLQQIRQHLGA